MKTSDKNKELENTSQYLTFAMRDENYAVKINHVREVLDLPALTKLPTMPAYMCGVISLREQVVPIMDLGQMLGMPPLADNRQATIIIFKTRTEDHEYIFGAVVDKVKTVIDLGADEIEPLPPMREDMLTDFIVGMGRKDNGFLIIIDIEQVMSAKELNSLTVKAIRDMKTMAAALTAPVEERQMAAGG
ncbi:MAG: chemotaxis protein CheW [Proteobacteria bacterium]|nr:chemotaxis protein CheW [Pseudomonadota bacterium]MBU1715247.1 chemotaxis protein CheW [Pseudomonadota bacterium]